MNALTPNQPDPKDPLFFVRLGEQSIREREQRRAAARQAATGEDEDLDEADDFADADPRYDGWTPGRQRDFLTALARGFSVTRAADMVGMSRQSAYALRESARGAAFALGWEAALLRARDVLADTLIDRAFNGVRETVTTDDGRVTTRHRHDNRLAMQMLARLDKRADAACTDTGAAAARLAAADFEQYLDLIGQDALPARAGLFIAARIERAGAEAGGQDDLAPVRALGRADRWLRTRADTAQPLDTADLDPAQRHQWTLEQWQRAEAAGLVQLAPEPPAPEPAARECSGARTDRNCQLRQPNPLDDVMDDEDDVWFDEDTGEYRTDFPPPAGFVGTQSGQFGDKGYWRTLSAEEKAVLDALDQARWANEVQYCRAARDNWFDRRRASLLATTALTAGVAGQMWDRGAPAADAPLVNAP
jgi:hypothetical protein